MARTTFGPARFSVYSVDDYAPGREFRLYRAVRSDNLEDPVLEDSFRSHYELGVEPRGAKRPASLHMALSMFDRREGAAGVALRWRKIGDYVAELVMRPGFGIDFARTGGMPGHFSVWGRPPDLVELVVGIVQLE